MGVKTVVLLTMLTLPAAVSTQMRATPSPEAVAANKHYKQGWDLMRAESWAEAAREFEAAIDNDPKFTLAYYSLGRAHMGLHDFSKAIAAYVKCRDLYVNATGDQYNNQVAATRRIDDKILEYRTAIAAAQARGSGNNNQSQSQSLIIRELQTQLTRLEQARDRNLNITLDNSVPFFVPMALGAAYFRSGRFADAEREYKAAIETNPDSGETHNNLAVLYLTTDRPADAEKELKAAEKTGFKVHPQLKADIEKRRKVSGY